jgi:hypothetical protein
MAQAEWTHDKSLIGFFSQRTHYGRQRFTRSEAGATSTFQRRAFRSAACHFQAMPFCSSQSVKPAAHIRRKTPARTQR